MDGEWESVSCYYYLFKLCKSSLTFIFGANFPFYCTEKEFPRIR